MLSTYLTLNVLFNPPPGITLELFWEKFNLVDVKTIKHLFGFDSNGKALSLQTSTDDHLLLFGACKVAMDTSVDATCSLKGEVV